MSTKKALLVAINTYSDPRANLPSCLDDARAFSAILTEHYQFDQIEHLFDDQAKMEPFVRQLDALFRDVQADDQVVLYFSGHGFRTQREGEDFLRECIVVYDGFFFDDELVQRSQDIPAGVLTVVLDSCFSGGLYKPFFVEQPGVELTQNKVWRPDGPLFDDVLFAEQTVTRVRPFCGTPYSLTDPPFVLAQRLRRQSDAIVADSTSGGTAGLQLNGLLIGACREDEPAAASTRSTSKPDGSEKLSAFTYCLRAALQKTLSAGQDADRLSSSDLVAATTQEVRRLGFKQTPVLQEPAQPAALGSRTFISLRPVTGTATTRPLRLATASLEDLLRALLRRTVTPQPGSASAAAGSPTTSTQTPVSPVSGGSVMTTAPATTTGQSSALSDADLDAQAKFLGALLPTIISALPGVISAFRRRDEPMLSGDVATTTTGQSSALSGADLDAQAKFLGALLPTIIRTLPDLIGAFRRRDEPTLSGDVATTTTGQSSALSDADLDAQAKFLGALLPTIISALPGVISAFRRRDEPMLSGDVATTTTGQSSALSDADLDAQAKFLGALLPTIIRTLPDLIGAFRRRDEPTLSGDAVGGSRQVAYAYR